MYIAMEPETEGQLAYSPFPWLVTGESRVNEGIGVKYISGRPINPIIQKGQEPIGSRNKT
jgi:hypothetical protein